MMGLRTTSARAAARETPARLFRAGREGLERRVRLDSTIGRWTYSGRITSRFMPDGTSIGGTPGVLFPGLNAVAPTATWQGRIEQAAPPFQVMSGGSYGRVGGFGLEVNLGSQTRPSIAPPPTVVGQQPDRGGGRTDDGNTATNGGTSPVRVALDVALGAAGPSLFEWSIISTTYGNPVRTKSPFETT